jgi:Na+-driven multidrug efflux pump
MISLGMGVTASALIGNEVGARNKERAKTLAKGCLLFITCTNIPILIVFAIYRQELAQLYSYDEEVVALIA